MKKLINFSVLFCLSLTGFSQYKNASIGISYGTSFTKRYNSIGIDYQYHFQNTFSFRTGFYLDRTMQVIDTIVQGYDELNNSSPVRYKNKVTNDFYAVPLLLQASFGEIIYFNIFGGVLLTGSLRNPYVNSEIYKYQNFDYNNSETVKGRVSTNYNAELKPYYGIGLSWPSKLGLTISLEVSDTRFVGKNLTDSRTYYSYDKLRFQFGLAYQFNFKKDSDFKMKNYFLKMTKSMNGI